MFDAKLRSVMAPGCNLAGRNLARLGLRPMALTAVGFVVGVGACVSVARRLWMVALILWVANRIFDGLDGAVARAWGKSESGALLDITADFIVYGGFIVGLAIADPSARLACAVLLLAYYVSGAAFLALSSLLERRGSPADDERSLRFSGGLAEGSETIVVYILFCLLPSQIVPIAWGFSVAVFITAIQRIVHGVHVLHPQPELEVSNLADAQTTSPR